MTTSLTSAAAAIGVEAPAPIHLPPAQFWGCVVLRRAPVLTAEDEPEIGPCEKGIKKCLFYPLAFILYLIGLLIFNLAYFFACFCLPCLGQAVRARPRMLDPTTFG